ncbi:Uncharacterised protein [Bordetella pertussis]|nr:Uncharacterised protein [Bordetella pertussis]
MPARRRASTSAGVPAGAHQAYQIDASIAGPPASLSVGASGKAGLRALEVTASSLMLPVLTCGAEVPSPSNIRSHWPPIRSCMAGAVPRYGMCVMETPASWLKVAATMCCAVPLPDEQ